MSSTERLDVLRERNKDLLIQLRHQTERLQKLVRSEGTPESVDGTRQTALKRPSKDCQNDCAVAEVNTARPSLQNGLNRDQADVMVTLVDANRGPARAALSKPTVSFEERENATARSEIESRAPSESADETGESTTQCKTSTSSVMAVTTQQGHVGDRSVYPGLLRDRGNRRPTGHVRSLHSGGPRARTSHFTREKEQREVGGVTFQSPEPQQESTLDRHRLQPLLGYDWIAGILDAESSLLERPEEFFSDLRMFRQVNAEECVHSQHVGLPEDDAPPAQLLTEEEHTLDPMDTHECTFCYRINRRLFTTPLDPQECCPVCKMPKTNHPHSAAEPALIRVSIPRFTLLPAHQYTAHRRSSFDPSDSVGLPSHCLSGWSNPAPSSVSRASSLDLRSTLNTAPPSGLASAQPQPMEQLEDVSVSGSTRSDQLMNVSRLARYRFLRLPPDRQPRGPSYPRSPSYPVF